MKFKTKLISAVVLGALGVATSAQAVYLSEDGRGEVLLYPYYSAQNGNDTLFSVVNTTAVGKAVKVRIIEGMNSYEVLDFNLYLSAGDAWSAVITADAATGGAKLITTDKSCTAPEIPAAGVTFRNFAILDSGPKALSRTKEGYIEIIEMGAIDPLSVLAPSTITFGKAITHVAGVPGDCAAIRNAWNTLTGAFSEGVLDEVVANSGGLVGSGTLINVAQGVDYSYDPVVLQAFSNAGVGNHTEPGSTTPSLADTLPRTSVVFNGAGVVTSDWASQNAGVVLPGVDAVSAVLMHQQVLNEFTVNPGLAAGTDLVITFPTKRQYIKNVTVAGAYTGKRPFTKDFLAVGGVATGACEPVTVSISGREEEFVANVTDFSPTPPAGGNSLCWEANVISFNGSNVLGSSNLRYDLASPWTDGWVSVTFDNAGHVMTDDKNTAIAGDNSNYRGLPAIGFAVQKYVNGNVGGVLSNYGGSFINKYVRLIN